LSYKVYFLGLLNPLSAIVQLTKHLGFEPGVQGTELPGVVHVEMALEMNLIS